MLAAYGEASTRHGRHRGYARCRRIPRVRQRVRDGVLDEVRVLGRIPFVRSPHEVREPVVHHHSAQAGHEHPQQAAIGIERGVSDGPLDDVGLAIQHCGHPSGFEVRAHDSMCWKRTGSALTKVAIQGNHYRVFPRCLTISGRSCDADRKFNAGLLVRRAKSRSSQRPPGIRTSRNTLRQKRLALSSRLTSGRAS